jgi:hypothetical protein
MLFHIRCAQRPIFFRIPRKVQVQDASFPIFPHPYVHIHPPVVKFENIKRWWRQQYKCLVRTKRSDWNVTSQIALILKVSRFNVIKKHFTNIRMDKNMFFWMWYSGRFEVRTDVTEEGVASNMTVKMNMRTRGCWAKKNHTMSRPKPYDVTSQTIRCHVPNHTMSRPKPHDVTSQTIRCHVPNRTMSRPKSYYDLETPHHENLKTGSHKTF